MNSQNENIELNNNNSSEAIQIEFISTLCNSDNDPHQSFDSFSPEIFENSEVKIQ